MGRLPVMLSAFVYPGAGQFVQKRWAAGAAWSLSFTAAFVAFAGSVIVPMVRNLKVALDWASDGGGGAFAGISPLMVGTTFVVALLVYILNLADVTRAHRRQTRGPPPVPPEM